MILLRGIPTKAFQSFTGIRKKSLCFVWIKLFCATRVKKRLCNVFFDIPSKFSYLILAFLLISFFDIYWHSFWPLIFYCLPERLPPEPQKHPIHMNLFFQISMSKLLALGTPVFPASKRCWKTPPWMKGPCCIRELPKVNAELFTLASFFPHQKKNKKKHNTLPRKASPMYWLHIPKCGTSFYNTVLHMPGACPGLGVNVSIDDEQFGKCFEVGIRTK